jgi:hypothetical protein
MFRTPYYKIIAIGRSNIIKYFRIVLKNKSTVKIF